MANIKSNSSDWQYKTISDGGYFDLTNIFKKGRFYIVLKVGVILQNVFNIIC